MKLVKVWIWINSALIAELTYRIEIDIFKDVILVLKNAIEY